MVRRLGSLVNKESEIIHSPFHGETLRGREAINAKIRSKNSDWKTVIIHTYSPFGVEFLNVPELDLKRGDSLSLRISLAGDETLFDGLVVNAVYSVNELNIVGVRTFIRDKKGDMYSGAERRSHRRWSCSDDFLPTGMAANPVKYNDYILFRVEDISSGGLKIITSMRNKFLGIGQKLECKLSIPYVGSIEADVKVKYINTTFYREKEFMIMGVEFIKDEPILLKSLGEYLLNFAKDVTVKSLNMEGFGIKNVSKWLDFSYVKTEEEYKQVLELRYKAYKFAGQLKEGTEVVDMSDEFDNKSHLLIAKYNNKIVGSVRISMYNYESEKIIHEKHKNEIKDFPDVREIAELSRLCIDPEYSGYDIINEIHAHELMIGIKNNKKFFLASSVNNLLPLYKKCGWKRTGLFTNPAEETNYLSAEQGEVMILDVNETFLGNNISFKYWRKFYLYLSDYLLDNELISKIRPLELIRLFMYRTAGRLLNVLQHK